MVLEVRNLPPPPTHTHSFPKVLHKEGCSDDSLKCLTTANQYEFHIWDLGTIALDYVRYKVGECLSLFYGKQPDRTWEYYETWTFYPFLSILKCNKLNQGRIQEFIKMGLTTAKVWSRMGA